MDHIQFIEAWRRVIAGVWPEVATNGIYHGAQFARIPFDVKADAGQLPVVVMEMDMRASPAASGLTGRVKEGIVSVYYIDKDSLTVEDELILKLEELRDAVWPSGELDYGSVIEDPDISWSLDLVPNRIFLNNSRPYVAGVVMAQCRAGKLAA